jgi:CRISPR-associated protein Csd2
VLYGLYVGTAVTCPRYIVENHVSDDDMRFFFEAIVKCWEHSHSGFRGRNNLRGFWVVKHKTPLGSCPDHMIEEALKISCADPESASCFDDYNVSFDREFLEGRGLTVVDLEEIYDNWGAPL